MSLDKTLTDLNRRDLILNRYEVENALPEHFGEKYPNLLKFLQEYYKTLEENSSPVSKLTDLMVARDIIQTNVLLCNTPVCCIDPRVLSSQ